MRLIYFKSLNKHRPQICADYVFVGRWLVLLSALVVLSACQSPYTKIDYAGTDGAVLSDHEVRQMLAQHSSEENHLQKDSGDFAVYCTGLYTCQIASIDNDLIINEQNGKPYRAAFEKNQVTFFKQDDDSVNVVGLGKSGKHDVIVRIYPVSMSAYEQFALVHNFAPNTVYRIHAYRKLGTLSGDDMSLLALAVPKPLCVKLYQNEKAVRQFCKMSDITTGFGEFFEVAVDSNSKQNTTSPIAILSKKLVTNVVS